MYKNVLDLHERLSKAGDYFNKQRGFPNGYGARVTGDQFSITKTQLLILILPLPGKTSDGFVARQHHDHFRIMHRDTHMSLVSFELDPEYHTFEGFMVNNGEMRIAVKYQLPAKYDAVEHNPMTQVDWEELTKENDDG